MSTETVMMIAACPGCGAVTLWTGHVAANGGGTTYSIACGCPEVPAIETKPL